MSQFDRYTTTEYVEALRKFLNVSKRNFLREAGFVDEEAEPRKGRLPRYKEEPILALEELVNEKGARCEAPDSTIGERYRIARDYKGLSDAEVSRVLGVSRELVRRWGADIHRPSSLDKLSELLDVPQKWLEEGCGEDCQNLPANSHLGVRVGEESKFWREQLYNMTLSVLGEIPEETDDVSYIQAYVEWTVYNRPPMAQAARRAGGRFHLMEGVSDPLFVPWVPIPPHETGRQLWSDEVEAIIDEELVRQHSVYAAWAALKKRCDELGIPEDQYPKRISLHKRVEKEKARMEKFGVDLNAQVAASAEKFATEQ
ncbi:helix-turn-helix domain-containing protein [Burkholderia ambifaria]|uniref:helix-turn-helix domain-containing protein n=1 Tax=Burkholderia ambifaria TaxID=152480 RepID=UPI000F7FF12F|nr:helix-turn-helix transcriptional regulator [Burkholderia ambifaria]